MNSGRKSSTRTRGRRKYAAEAKPNEDAAAKAFCKKKEQNSSPCSFFHVYTWSMLLLTCAKISSTVSSKASFMSIISKTLAAKDNERS